MQSENEPDTLEAFRALYARDQEEGSPRGLADYLRLFPGRDEELAREFVNLELGVTQVSPHSGRDGDATGKTAPDHLFGHYVLLRELGRGGQGRVFLARDRVLGRDVALKLLLGGGIGGARERMRFEREARIVSKLDHPGICTVYDFGEEEGMPYLAMRLIQGRSLREVIARSRGKDPSIFVQSAEEASVDDAEDGRIRSASAPSTRDEFEALLDVIESAARALHYAHEKGLIHRDLKPANIMVGAEGQAVILDFGLARDSEAQELDVTRTGDLLGTPGYMSPEQITRGSVGLDCRTDVFSLGVILYEWATGVHPFSAPTRQEVLSAVGFKDPARPSRLNPRISRDLEAVIETAMRKDADRRYRSAEALADDLARIRRGEPVLARRTPNLERAYRWLRRRPATAAILTVFLPLIVVLVALMVSREREKRARERAFAARGMIGAILDEVPELERLSAENGARIRDWLTRARSLEASLPSTFDEAARIAGEGDTGINQQRLEADGARLGQAIGRMERFGRLIEETRVASLETAAADWRNLLADLARDPRPYDVATVRRLEPGFNLAPFRRDPISGLCEFWLPASGRRPEWDASAGRLLMDEDSALVVVLLPGGPFVMGSQAGATLEDGRRNREIRHEVRLDPFFISVVETPRSVLERIEEEDPSYYRVGQAIRFSGIVRPVSVLNPIEYVDRASATRLAARLGGLLPTEAQAEYAFLGGEPGHLWQVDAAEAAETENLADRAYDTAGTETTPDPADDGDGAPIHGAVPFGEANPFGIHDAGGNVMEWARDDFLDAYPESHDGDGLIRGGSTRDGVARGGSFRVRPKDLDLRYRFVVPVLERRDHVGFRIVLPF